MARALGPGRVRSGTASGLAAGLLALVLLAGGARAAEDDPLQPFFGTYVGVATVEDYATGERHERDMDLVIAPYHDGGFRIDWINVSLVDGRRDLPGVERRVQTVLFEPSADGTFFVEVEEDNPFERTEKRPMRGDPVRWAAIAGPTLHLYTFVVLDDGRYEMQIYDRVLTDKGIDIRYERIVDGQVMRRITGTTARAKVGSAGD